MSKEHAQWRPSPFFDSGSHASAESIAILHLKRDQLQPVTLRSSVGDVDGYAEGAVTNTRFGSFPHSTLIGLPWGSQVLASKVDTGSRGRKGTKRKLEDETIRGDSESQEQQQVKQAVSAGSGFIHLLPPTPETWTVSLPHRTQVVYTPDYSYILQRLRVCPGQTIIEAGAGSGSFTHAAARSVFNGYPSRSSSTDEPPSKRQKYGKVCSYEYHEPRVEGLRKELLDHGLSEIVQVSHRDVYGDGFLLKDSDQPSPEANAIFLDLPAPWKALRHLTRRPLPAQAVKRVTLPAVSDVQEPLDLTSESKAGEPNSSTSAENYVTALDPATPVHICTFSPCIEQVQETVAAMRQSGWTEIEMVEVQQRRIDVRRERVGLDEEGLHGTNATAADVEEAVERLREVEGRFKLWHEQTKANVQAKQNNGVAPSEHTANGGAYRTKVTMPTKQERLDKNKRKAGDRKLFKEGNLVHRTEPEVKSHTSYLVFAILPREWTEEDEQRCLQEYGAGPTLKEEPVKMSKKEAKRAKFNSRQGN